MTCREFTDFLEAYFARELEPRVRSAFDRHVEVCANCVTYLKSYEETIRLGKDAFAQPDQAVEQAPEELVQAILRARRKG